MTTSSAQPTCSITYVNGVSQHEGFIAQEISSIDPNIVDTITLSPSATGSSYFYNTGAGVSGTTSSTVTISGGGTGYTIGAIGSSNTFTFNDINVSQFNWKDPVEFVDTLPDISRIKAMCEQYPGLKIAYEKFVTTYKLVKDHYDTPEDQRPIP